MPLRNRCAWKHGASSAAALLLFALVALLAPFAQSQTRLASLDQERATSRYGVLKVKEYDDLDKRLLFNGRAVLSLDDFHGANYLTVEAQTRVGLHDIYVIAGSCCIACDTEYVILDITGSRAVHHTVAFGTCSSEAIVTRAGNELRLDMPDVWPSYRLHPPKYLVPHRWRYLHYKLIGPQNLAAVKPEFFGQEIDYKSRLEERAQARGLRRIVRRAPAPAAINPADLTYSKVLTRNQRDGWASRAFYEPFDHIPPGQWRSVRRGRDVLGVIGVSRDGRAALVVSHDGGCGPDCADGPTFQLILRRPLPSSADCASNHYLKGSVEGEEVSLDLDGNRLSSGAFIVGMPGLTIAVGKTSFVVWSLSDTWNCYTWEFACVESSPLLRLKATAPDLHIADESCPARKIAFDFDLSSAPFFAINEWRRS